MPKISQLPVAGGILGTELLAIVQGGITKQLSVDDLGVAIAPASDTYTAESADPIVSGAYVYIKSDGKIANAFADVTGEAALGFVLVGVGPAQMCTMYFNSRNTSLTGLTIGSRLFLSDIVPGEATTTPPVGVGKKCQFLGTAISTTSIDSDINGYIVLG